MQTKYCIMPDEERFFAFLSAQSFSESELLQLRLMHINQICVDETTQMWEVHFSSAAHLTDGILQAAASKMAAAFSLQHVDMICDGDGRKCSLPLGNTQPEVEITECTGEPLAEELPLPPEPLDMEIGQTEPPSPPCEVSEEPVVLKAKGKLEEGPEYPEPAEPSPDDLAYMQAYEALMARKRTRACCGDGQSKGKYVRLIP